MSSGLPRWLPKSDTVPTPGSADAGSGTGALMLTKTAPVGYDPGPTPPAGTPVWVTWGTAGSVIPPPETFLEPIGYVTAAGVRYVWAKVGLSEAVPFLASSLAFVSDVSPTGYATPAFVSGVAPVECYIPLGSITATGTAPDLVVTLANNGRGSISVAIGITGGAVEAATNRITSLTRNLSYWRVDAG